MIWYFIGRELRENNYTARQDVRKRHSNNCLKILQWIREQFFWTPQKEYIAHLISLNYSSMNILCVYGRSYEKELWECRLVCWSSRTLSEYSPNRPRSCYWKKPPSINFRTTASLPSVYIVATWSWSRRSTSTLLSVSTVRNLSTSTTPSSTRIYENLKTLLTSRRAFLANTHLSIQTTHSSYRICILARSSRRLTLTLMWVKRSQNIVKWRRQREFRNKKLKTLSKELIITHF